MRMIVDGPDARDLASQPGIDILPCRTAGEESRNREPAPGIHEVSLYLRIAAGRGA
jgi:hypothetical protein